MKLGFKLPLPKASHKTPLAWCQLSHKKVRLAVATTGIAFANILMFTQLGFLSVLTKGTTQIHENLTGDLLLLSASNKSLQIKTSFPNTYLHKAEAIDGVASASPVYISWGRWVNPESLSQKTSNKLPSFDFVKIIAFNPSQPPVLNIPEINRYTPQLNEPHTVLFDRLSASSLGQIPELLNREGDLVTMMDNHRTHIVGAFTMGRSFYESGNVVMSDWTYVQHNPRHSLDRVTIGVIALKPGTNVDRASNRLRKTLPEDVAVLTHEELIAREKIFQESQPAGIVLKFGTVVGFIVGLIILYQVLYADVSDHLPEYATLKAIGYSNKYLVIVVLQEAMILGLIGFLPGFLISLWLYQLLATLTQIQLIMRSTVVINVFILSMVMCCISGFLATSKLRSADPADVF